MLLDLLHTGFRLLAVGLIGGLITAWMVVVGCFQPDIPHGVFFGSMLVTFVGSVMGDDQSKRLQNGAFGAAAGTSLGGLAGLLKNNTGLVVVGFAGSAVGGFLGWLYYAILAWKAGQDPKLKNYLVFQVNGLQGLQQQLDVQSRENLRTEFSAWSENFARTVAAQKQLLLKFVSDAHWEDYAVAGMQDWLTSAADILSLVFGTLADKTQYQSRVTIIIYGLGEDNKPNGKHWISYAGQLTPHGRQVFDETSIGYKVLSQQLPSPYFTTSELAKGQGQARADDPSYRPFITLRLNASAILAVDWPEKLEEKDAYVQAARSLFYSHITLALTELLDMWPRPLARVVGLKPLSGNDSPPAADVPLPAKPEPPKPEPDSDPTAMATVAVEPAAPVPAVIPTTKAGTEVKQQPLPPLTAGPSATPPDSTAAAPAAAGEK
jgi:hypothetical protein